MTVPVDERELKLVLEKLDTVKLVLLRLRATLLPEEQASIEEKEEIAEAEQEIKKESTVTLEEFIKELGC